MSIDQHAPNSGAAHVALPIRRAARDGVAIGGGFSLGVAYYTVPRSGLMVALSAFLVTMFFLSSVAGSRTVRRFAVGVLAAMATAALCFAGWFGFALMTWRGM